MRKGEIVHTTIVQFINLLREAPNGLLFEFEDGVLLVVDWIGRKVVYQAPNMEFLSVLERLTLIAEVKNLMDMREKTGEVYGVRW